MEKNLSDKNKYENLQNILDKLSSKDIVEYLYNKTPQFLTMDIQNYIKMKLEDRKAYVWNKMKTELKLNPILKNYVLVLVESLKMNKATLFLIEDNLKMIQELALLKEKQFKWEKNLGLFLDYQNYNYNDIKFSAKDIDAIIYDQTNKFIGDYIRNQTNTLNNALKEEFRVNIDMIRRKYSNKYDEINNKIRNEISSELNNNKIIEIGIWNNFKIKSLDRLTRLKRYINKRRIGQAIGIVNQIKKDVNKINKDIDKNFNDNNNKFWDKFNNKFNNTYNKYNNKVNIIKESDELDQINDTTNKNNEIHKTDEFKDLDTIYQSMIKNRNNNFVKKFNINDKNINLKDNPIFNFEFGHNKVNINNKIELKDDK